MSGKRKWETARLRPIGLPPDFVVGPKDALKYWKPAPVEPTPTTSLATIVSNAMGDDSWLRTELIALEAVVAAYEADNPHGSEPAAAPEVAPVPLPKAPAADAMTTTDPQPGKAAVADATTTTDAADAAPPAAHAADPALVARVAGLEGELRDKQARAACSPRPLGRHARAPSAASEAHRAQAPTRVLRGASQAEAELAAARAQETIASAQGAAAAAEAAAEEARREVTSRGAESKHRAPSLQRRLTLLNASRGRRRRRGARSKRRSRPTRRRSPRLRARRPPPQRPTPSPRRRPRR